MSEEWRPPTVEELMRLAKQIEHEGSYDGNLPEIIRQCAERISELEDDRDEWKTQHENLLSVKAADNAALLANADRADRFAKINIGVAGKIAAENERLRSALGSIANNTCCDGCREAALVARAALASCDERPSGLRPEGAQGASPPARPDEGGGRPSPSPWSRSHDEG